ncbi:MAG: hypothetical protein KDD60_02305 [Bdellovibrionales bacterium]|nr:hypothetical protein [Bdellovibrionales bacterium]
MRTLVTSLFIFVLANAAVAEDYNFSTIRSSDSSDWEFMISPTLGIPASSGDLTIDSVGTTDLDVGLGDTPSNYRPWLGLDFEMIHQPSRLGLALGISYTDLENSINGPDRFFSFDADLSRLQMDALILFRLIDGDSTVDLYGGVQLTQYSVQAGGQDPSGFIDYNEDYDIIDPVIGLRASPALTDTLSLHLQGDTSIGGDSDTMTNASAGLIWQQNEVLALAFLYQVQWLDFKDDDGFELDTVTHGPTFGLQFRFGS